jgi:hypothetical protein
VYHGRFFVVPVEVVLADIRQQVAAGATHITFGDPDFLNGPRHALQVLDAAHAEFPALTFDVTVKIEHILTHRTLLPEMAKRGVIFLVSAVESLSDVVLHHLEKGHTRSDVLEALGIVQEAGIALRPTFVAFTPWTTLHDYLDVLRFVEAYELADHVDPVQYSLRLLVPPGSGLLQREAIRPFLSSGGTRAPNDRADAETDGRIAPQARETFSHAWTHPDPRMDALQRDVTVLVETDAASDEDTAVTFYRVRELATAVHENRAPRHVTPFVDRDRIRPPHLSEPWFC